MARNYRGLPPAPADWLRKPLLFFTKCQYRHSFLISSVSLVSIPAHTSNQ